ncbi:MAG: ABC transporter ATP-binding protein [Treponema sp.]|nr:ABC transporter ATP-binding protein [Treponema sp.]
MIDSNPILQVDNLSLSFYIKSRYAKAVDSVSFALHKGEMVALVGESGCGKTMTSLCIMGLQPRNAKVEGSVFCAGNDVLRFSEKRWMEYRGKKIAMIFQEPLSALNPLLPVGFQIAEAGMVHGMHKRSAKEKALDLMAQVGLPHPKQLYEAYPYQLSGGQRQRIIIASALMNDPDILIADEPTSSLDVTIQAQIMAILADLHKKTDTALLLISHDMDLVKESCDRMYIMYAGRIIESGTVSDIFLHPLHPYTQGLLRAIPSGFAAETQQLQGIPGVVPSIESRQYDCCLFYERCTCHKPLCQSAVPDMLTMHAAHSAHCVACHAVDYKESL